MTVETSKVSWWSKATVRQKLAQLDGGIELEMSAEQIAICSGTTADDVEKFALKHNRHI